MQNILRDPLAEYIIQKSQPFKDNDGNDGYSALCCFELRLMESVSVGLIKKPWKLNRSKMEKQ
jgi:hypothetical protein